jgi:3,4-dihydroxy 2-butanone 4-phosphate synthase/GTP cyclohydrolase II
MSAASALYSTDDVEDFALDPVEQAIADIAAGRPVVVVDDEDRENEGDLVIAAEKATPEIVAFMMSECRGLICAPMEGEELDRLKLPQMVEDNTESMKTAFTVSVDACAAHGVSTGISASDRATTLQLLADGVSGPDDFVRPGHIFPLRARPGGVLTRNGHTEAAVDLARLAGLRPAGAIVEIAGEDGTMLRLPELIPFARKHGLTIISIEDLIAYRRSSEPTVRREARTQLPTAHGTFTAYGYRSCTARSARATTSWSASTPNASPATSSAPPAATAVPSSTPRWPASRPRAGESWSTCADTRAAASA